MQIILHIIFVSAKENKTSASSSFMPPLHKAEHLLSTVIGEDSGHFVCQNVTHKQQNGSILLHSARVI